MHRKLIRDIIETKDDSIMRDLECMVIDMLDKLKVSNHDEYKEIEYKMYKLVHGEHLDKELAHKWVSSMTNKDGTKGEHWTMEQTNPYAGNLNKCDFYAVLNMMYSDYYNPKFDTNTYIELAKCWLNDEDISNDKTLKYYMFVVCK